MIYLRCLVAIYPHHTDRFVDGGRMDGIVKPAMPFIWHIYRYLSESSQKICFFLDRAGVRWLRIAA